MVAVVILNFKVRKLALNCVKSVLKSNYQDIKIIVVDNDSKDGIAEEVKTLPAVEFIQTGGNLGYSGGNNQGIRKALELGADFILILNPDTTIKPDTIINLLKTAKNCQAQIIGPKIYFSDSKKIWYAGGIFDQANVLGSHRGVNEIDHKQYESVTETDYVSGAALFVKSDVFQKIGLFDERYFLYYEDTDFCLRAKKSGIKIVYDPTAVVYHANAQSTGLGSPLQDYYMSRNRLLLAFKFLPLRTKLAVIREMLVHFDKRTRRKALLDFLTFRFGKAAL